MKKAVEGFLTVVGLAGVIVAIVFFWKKNKKKAEAGV